MPYRKAEVKPACAGLPPKSPLYCGTMPQAVPIQTNLTQYTYAKQNLYSKENKAYGTWTTMNRTTMIFGAETNKHSESVLPECSG
uniref:Uncharacterized protein n=1 Tax=Vespula pensylvanica TaxID=30213 RepID=A0A834NX58_VESPE|nr:hypothetical protein H0235_010493 [Vespula pensylvanica]